MGAEGGSAHPADDNGLIQDVGAMLQMADPVPRRVREAARALSNRPTVENELAELLRAAASPRRVARSRRRPRANALQARRRGAATASLESAPIVLSPLRESDVALHLSFPDRPSASAPVIEESETARIVRGVLAGDRVAWDQLVERYSGLLWGVARAHRLSAADAADVVQTSWERLIEHLPRIQNPDGVGAWLATTVRRECLRTLRVTARCQPSDEIDALAGVDAGDIDTALLRAERDAALHAAFGRLPARDQALLRLLTTDPAPSYEEIGAGLGMPVGSIGPTRARSLERLRRELRGTGVLGNVASEGRA